MKTFEVKTLWSRTTDCVLEVDRYADNGHIALSIWSESEGPFAHLTVNLPYTKQYPHNYGFVDVNNFPEAEAVIKQLGIGKYAEVWAVSGFCTYPLYEFDLVKIVELING